MALRALFKPLDLLPNGSVSYLYSRQCREQHLLCSLAEDWQCRCGDHWAIRGKKRKWWVQIGNRQTPEQNDVGSSLAQRYWIGRGTRSLPWSVNKVRPCLMCEATISTLLFSQQSTFKEAWKQLKRCLPNLLTHSFILNVPTRRKAIFRIGLDTFISSAKYRNCLTKSEHQATLEPDKSKPDVLFQGPGDNFLLTSAGL